MFFQNRFTERAAEALRLAQETAGQMGHSYVAPSICSPVWQRKAGVLRIRC